MLSTLALLIACLALARDSRSARQGIRYGLIGGALVWLVPFGASALLVGW